MDVFIVLGPLAGEDNRGSFISSDGVDDFFDLFHQSFGVFDFLFRDLKQNQV